MKKIIVFAITGLLFGVMACNQNKESTSSSTEKNSPEIEQGLKLLAQNCYLCHSPSAKENELLAPPMAAVKKHYLEQRGKIPESQFIDEVISFVREPSEDKALMPEAVERFGLMLPLPLSDEQLTSIAKAIYETDLPQPDWFDEHYNENN